MSKGFEPMRMTWGFLVHFVARRIGHMPTAQEIVEYTGQDPELFPEQWPIEQAVYALTHMEELVPTQGDDPE